MPIKTIKAYLTSRKISNDHVVLLITTSLLLYLIDGFFSVKDYITTPQFTETCNKQWFSSNADVFNTVLYNLYFIIDFIWAPTLLLFIFKYVRTKIYCKRSYKWLPTLVLVLSIIALTLDYIENSYYLSQYAYPNINNGRIDIPYYKLIAYFGVALIFIIVVIWDMTRDDVLLVLDFLKSSWISIIILLLFGLTLPSVPQFNSIVVDLYYKYFQFTLLFIGILTPVYVLVLSHYPNYFLLNSNKDNGNNKVSQKDWRMSGKWWLFGTIWFINKKSTPANKEYEGRIGFLRKTLGIFYLSAVFFLLADTADTNFNIKIKFAKFTIPIMVGLIAWLYYHAKKYAKWREINNPYLKVSLQNDSDGIYKKATKEKDLKPDSTLLSISKYSKKYAIWLTLCIALIIILSVNLYIDRVLPYNIKNVVLSLCCVVAQGITYIYYRIYRSSFKYAFFNPKHEQIFSAFNYYTESSSKNKRDKADRKKLIIDFFNKNDFKQNSQILKLFSKFYIGEFSFGTFSNSVVFLRKIIYVGIINLVLLFIFNIYNEKAIHINSVIIILSYFLLFYGVIVILLKHGIYYYKSTDTHAIINRSKYFKTLTGALFILLILNYLARFNSSTKNNLYKLNQLKRVKVTNTNNHTLKYNELTLKDYVTNLDYSNRFYVGCYGGGMKSNAWTMTVLNDLDKKFDFMNKATCLSGASGGTIGLINFSTIYNNPELNDNTRKKTIERIATENILGIDLIHFLGRDFFTHLFVPGFDLKGRDRSTAAMKVYAKYAGYPYTNPYSRIFDKQTFRTFWKEMYTNNNKKFPILIVNTTNIKGKQGMAVSVASSGKAKEAIYYGADDIAEINYTCDNTLSYYNTASTSNRFPLLSPAATIQGKGQYSDGGIFDNSGLLSAFKLYRAIETMAPKKSKKNVFVNIINDKNLFIKYYLKDFFEGNKANCFIPKINEVSEIPAIINSVSSTEMVPDHIKNRIAYLSKNYSDLEFISIYLPHSFDLEDVKRVHKPLIKNLECVDEIVALIEKNNLEIYNLTKNSDTSIYRPIIEPELSRVIAKPAYNFMKDMLNHSCVKKEVEKLKPFLLEE